MAVETDLPLTCYYCGREIKDGTPKKKRSERGLFYWLHAACAQNWDNEKRRL